MKVIYFKNNINIERMRPITILPFFFVAILLVSSLAFAQSQYFCTDNVTLNRTIDITISGTRTVISELINCPYGCNSVQSMCIPSPYPSETTPFIDELALTFFLGNIAIMLAKIYNVSKLGKGYDRVWIFLLMIFSFFSWLIMLVYLQFTTTLDKVFYFQLTSIIMAVNFFLMILEVLLLWTRVLEKKPSPREHRTLFK